MLKRFGFLQIVLLLLGAFLIVRFLPLLLRLGQGVAIGLRTYWWAVLPLVIFFFVLWKIKRRQRQRPALRDVTHSLKD